MVKRAKLTLDHPAAANDEVAEAQEAQPVKRKPAPELENLLQKLPIQQK